ncbi:uncharacterized protein LOC114448919 isoform X2 [Parambassis ranga]|uniref:Uncharacterized protein LOC114448919 isoform X2 n=1 Tax=Parambassis ranga TaxID=210632 RepID=A0A6P7JZA4_9TELE|nr:uncharacterized protein LOC114448919 isoform X2 [Parambassis ranga]
MVLSHNAPQVLTQQHDCKEEEILSDQQLCNQETNCSLDWEQPEPTQIKEEQQVLCSSDKGEQHVLNEKADPLFVTAAHESNHIQPDQSCDVVLSHNSPGKKCLKYSLKMATPAKLRIIMGENDIHKLLLPSGIPGTLQELLCIIQETFCIPGEFTVMSEDADFGGQFFTLSSIEEVVDRGTLKIVQAQAPVILNLPSVEEADVDHSLTGQTFERCSSIPSGSHANIILSPSDGSDMCGRSQPWPAKFQVPAFSYVVNRMLEAGNLAYQKDGTLLNNPRLISSVLEKLAEEIFRYTAYPTGVQVLAVVEALMEKYPCLKEPGSFNGLYGWQQRIKYKMGNYRAKLRCRQLACPELEVNTRKRLSSNENGRTKGIKRPKKAEVNYLPPLPFGDTVDTLEQERQDLLKEATKKNNDGVIADKMERSFSYRRLEVVKQCPAVKAFMERWPSLFSETQIKAEFRRITAVHLERTFLSQLDFYTPKLSEIFAAKGGVAGTKIRPLLLSFSQEQVESRRDAIIRCLMEYLSESTEELIKDYQDISKEEVKEDYAAHLMKICVISSGPTQEGLAATDVSVIIEGTEVLADCKSVAKACLLLMGLIYAMNLSYPTKLRYTFEVFQKLFLKLDCLKMSPKVQALHNKLLG